MFLSFLPPLIQVDAFLEENDSGLTDADKKVADGEFFLVLFPSLEADGGAMCPCRSC